MMLHRSGLRETSRQEVDLIVQDKKGTPTMGGLLIIFSFLLSCILWCDISSVFIFMPMAAAAWFGMIGYVDDKAKIRQSASDVGLSRSKKLVFQGLFGVILAFVLYSGLTTPFPQDIITNLYIPFFKSSVGDISWLYYLFCIFIVISISNAVNFADGLDGLAIVPASTTAAVYAVLAYIIGNAIYSEYLLYHFMPGAGELTVLCAGLIGSGLGFLWFNAYPAQIFMGDTGSQAIGGLIATIALLLKQEFVFLIAGGIFLAEAVSVLVQDRIGIAKIGRRIFFRAPLHHTFQFRGLSETTVVVRFWIISVLLALMSIVTIKIR